MDINQRAIRTFGEDNQINIAIEELSELITALCHHRRKKANELQVCSEIADVMIMCEQLRLIFGSDDVDSEKMKKLLRLDKTIASH